MPHIYAITTHNKDPQLLAEYWKEDGICAVGHGWTFKEEYGDELPTDRFQLFPEISKGDIILAFATSHVIAYVGEVADNKLRDERENKIGRRYKYWNQRKVTWWDRPSHFHSEDLPLWMREQLPKRGQTTKKFNLKGRTFKEAKSTIKTDPRSGSALAPLNEDMVKAGLRSYFLSYAHVFERGLKIRRVEKEVARGHRPEFEGEDAAGTPVIIECKGSATATCCDQLARYSRKYYKGKRRPQSHCAAGVSDGKSAGTLPAGVSCTSCAKSPFLRWPDVSVHITLSARKGMRCEASCPFYVG